MRRETILSADIGGTNTRFVLHELILTDEIIGHSFKTNHHVPGEVILNKKYENQDYMSFLEVLQQFLTDAGASRPPLVACLAVAGPVKNNVVRFTNRASDAWVIDGYVIAEQLGIRSVLLINDFLAVGYGILTLDEDKDCCVLQEGTKDPTAPIACIGAGTGLGQCFLTPNSDGNYQCFPSEGGHAEFTPRDDIQIGLLKYLKTKFKHHHRVSVERVVSGTGLVNIYEFLSLTYPEYVDEDIHAKIQSAGDLKGRVIATNQQNIICKQTMEIFITSYGAEAGVAALKWLPYGGLYLTGGLTPRNIDLIRVRDGPFMTALLDKGRVSGMLCSIPIYAVLADNLGERGAHLMSFKLMQKVVNEEIAASLPLNVSPTPSSPDPSNIDAVPSKKNSSSIFYNTSLLAALAFGAGGLLVGLSLSKRK